MKNAYISFMNADYFKQVIQRDEKIEELKKLCAERDAVRNEKRTCEWNKNIKGRTEILRNLDEKLILMNSNISKVQSSITYGVTDKASMEAYNLGAALAKEFSLYRKKFMKCLDLRLKKTGKDIGDKLILPYLYLAGGKFVPGNTFPEECIKFSLFRQDGGYFDGCYIHRYYHCKSGRIGNLLHKFLLNYEDKKRELSNALAAIIHSKGGKYNFIGKDIVKIICRYIIEFHSII